MLTVSFQEAPFHCLQAAQRVAIGEAGPQQRDGYACLRCKNDDTGISVRCVHGFP